jgi:LysR family transcriptional regulator for bpeEF and oprC
LTQSNVRKGGRQWQFSAVARERSCGQPTVSKQIAALESTSVRNCYDTSRSLSLTEAGQDFYESAVVLIGISRPPNLA